MLGCGGCFLKGCCWRGHGWRKGWQRGWGVPFKRVVVEGAWVEGGVAEGGPLWRRTTRPSGTLRGPS